MDNVRKTKFSITLKLSLLIVVIIIVSFFFVFSFYIKSTKQDFIDRIDSEISIKIDALKQDIINFSLGVEEGDFRLSILEDKINTLYKLSQDKIAAFESIKFLNKDGIVIVDTNPKNRLKSFFEVEKVYGKDHFQYVINLWNYLRRNYIDEYNKDFIILNGKSIYQIILPIYYFFGAKENVRLNIFFEFYKLFKNDNLLVELPLEQFYLESLYLFKFINDYNYLYEDNKITAEGNSIISESLEYYKNIVKINRKTKGFVPPFYPIRTEDIKAISSAISGLQYFVKTYWYTRVKTGKDIIRAIDNISVITKKGVINNILKEIIEDLSLIKDLKKPFEEVKPKILIKIKKIEEIYKENILPFKEILSEREENLSSYMESMMNFLDYIESNLKSIDKIITVISNFDKNLKILSERTVKLLKNYLSVSVREQDYAVNKVAILKAIDSVYKIKVFELYKGNNVSFDEKKKELENEINYLKNLIMNNGAFYKPIEITDSNLENTLTLKDYRSMMTYFFLIYMNEYVNIFKKGSNIRDNIRSILSNPIPSMYKTFSESDINMMTEKIKEVTDFFLSFRDSYKKGILSDLVIRIDTKKWEDVFNLLFKRYHIGYLLMRISQDKLQEAFNKRINSLVDLFLNLLIRFVFIGVILSLIFLNRFKKINTGIKAIGEGNFDYKILIKGNDEIGQLADHLNTMAEHLREKTRMEGELKAARIIQESLLPKEYPDFHCFKFSSYYSAQVETGGDYFDFIKIDDKNLGLVIADVSGHGVGACLVMSMIRTIIRTYSTSILDPKKILLILNDYIFKNTPSNMYATIFYGVINTDGKLVYSNAGHNPSIIYTPSKSSIKTLEGGGMVCGLVDKSVFENTVKNFEVKIDIGDIFIQYTDGVTEAENSKREQYGFDRLRNFIKNSNSFDIEELFKKIIDDLGSFTGGVLQSDDITMMGLQFIGVKNEKV